MTPPHHPLQYLVTGARGAGKTTFCSRLVAAVRSRCPGIDIAGIISPKDFAAGEELAIDAVDLVSGRRRRLARRRPTGSTTAGPATPRWEFEAAALDWGNAVLGAATPCDLLVVDELGPLELERGEGWVSGLAAVDGAAYQVALVVVRPELVAGARRRWPRAEVLTIEDPEAAVAAARSTAVLLQRALARR